MNESRQMIENLIIGAGPGGIQLGYFFQRLQIPYLIIERAGGAGSFFRQFPRHRKLISINKVHTGCCSDEVALRWDWNSLLTDDSKFLFKDYDTKYFPHADSLVKYMEDFIRTYNIRLEYSKNVVSIGREQRGADKVFIVACADGSAFEAKRLFVCTGYANERIPQIEGAEHVVSYSRVEVDPERFKNKRVLIIGKGNSAFETGDNLVEVAASIHLISPSPLRFAWKTHYVGDLRAVNNNLVDTYQLKSQNSVQNAEIRKIVKDGEEYVVTVSYPKTNGETRDIRVDCVISCAGFKFDASIFDVSCALETCYGGKFPKLNPAWESVNIPGLYFAGALMHSNDFRKSFSGFIHGFRYNIKILSNIIAYRYYHRPWRRGSINVSGGNLAQIILHRLVECSSLFQLPGFLSYTYKLNRDSEGQLVSVDSFDEMPKDYFEHDNVDPAADEYLKVYLEFGKLTGPDPFDANDDPNEELLFLHPVVHYYQGGKQVDELHLPQDLEHQWDSPKHRRRLAQWIEPLECGEFA